MESEKSLLKIENIDCVPIIHGKSIFAQEVRKKFLEKSYSCVAVELPMSLYATVIEAVGLLPQITAVVYKENSGEFCYVPIEPGEGIIEAIRLASGERKLIEFIDLETDSFPVENPLLPDEYAIKDVGIESYYEKIIPILINPKTNNIQEQREIWMAGKLRELSKRFNKILFVCGIAHLEGIKHHFYNKTPLWKEKKVKHDTQIYNVHPDSIYLLTGEIPYITYLYEKNRYSIFTESFEKTDGIKELLIETRKDFCKDFPEEEELLTPGTLQVLLNYLRNLCLIQTRFTPSMYDLIVAGKGVGGGGFAAKLAEMSKFYPYQDPFSNYPLLRVGLGKIWSEEHGETNAKNRLPGSPFSLKNMKLDRMPAKEKKAKWKKSWGNVSQCSWPEEDEKIENFTNHVKARAIAALHEEHVRVEKFQTSIKDGIDIRETLRNWHTSNIYVKEVPTVKGEVGAVIFIFDNNTREYPWKSTWLAEHQNESTLAFYATDYRDDIVGPGIARAYYGGALFIFPPVVIYDIWYDVKFKEERNSIEKIVAAGCYYSSTKYVAYVSMKKPDFKITSIAHKLNKHLIYMPLSSFSAYTIRKLRKFHVLQGHHIRSYARDYIR